MPSYYILFLCWAEIVSYHMWSQFLASFALNNVKEPSILITEVFVFQILVTENNSVKYFMKLGLLNEQELITVGIHLYRRKWYIQFMKEIKYTICQLSISTFYWLPIWFWWEISWSHHMKITERYMWKHCRPHMGSGERQLIHLFIDLPPKKCIITLMCVICSLFMKWQLTFCNMPKMHYINIFLHVYMYMHAITLLGMYVYLHA